MRQKLMTTNAMSLVLVLSLAAACGPPVAVTTPKVDLKIKSVTPDTVYTDGNDTITVVTENGCDKGDVTIKIDNVPITSAAITSDVAGTYQFPSPAKNTDQRVSVELSVECAKLPASAGGATVYNVNKASSQFTYDPALEPQPKVKNFGPYGDKITVLGVMVVTFDRAMDPTSITDKTVYLHGITGKTVYTEANFTATFTPNEQLPYSAPQTAIVLGGPNGVHSKKTGKTLLTHLKPGGGTPDPNQDSWTFTTRCEGCGNPWMGDISAAAGISTGGNYKLFSVTGQATPVGEAFAGTPANHTYKLESGFIYATDPATGN